MGDFAVTLIERHVLDERGMRFFRGWFDGLVEDLRRIVPQDTNDAQMSHQYLSPEPGTIGQPIEIRIGFKKQSEVTAWMTSSVYQERQEHIAAYSEEAGCYTLYDPSEVAAYKGPEILDIGEDKRLEEEPAHWYPIATTGSALPESEPEATRSPTPFYAEEINEVRHESSVLTRGMNYDPLVSR